MTKKTAAASAKAAAAKAKKETKVTKTAYTEPEKKSIFKMDISFGTTSLTNKAVFAKNMAVMIRSGLRLDEALDIAAQQQAGKFRRILNNVLRMVQSGNTFSNALAKYPKVFSGLFINVVYAGEISGTLDENLEIVAKQLEKDKELVTKIKGAMLYPAVILSAVFVMGVAMAFLVLPKITPLLKALNVELPFTTRALIWFADTVANRGLTMFVVIIAGATFIVWLFKRNFMHPFTHWLILHLPIIGQISRKTNLARFCRTFGTLMESGLNIDEAIDVSKETVTNYYYRQAMEKVAARVRKGTELSNALGRYDKLYPPLVVRMISVGEKSGKIEEILFYLASFYELEVETSTKSLSTTIEPILLIVIGTVVAGFALAIITPIYQVTGNISPTR